MGWPRRQTTHTVVLALLYMIKDVLQHQDVPVVSGRGPLTTQPSGDLQMLCAAVNLVADSHVPNLQTLITLMVTPAEVLMPKTVAWTQDAPAVIGLGQLMIQHSGALLMLSVGARQAVTATRHLLHLLHLLLVITTNSAMTATLLTMTTATTCTTATNVLGLGLRMTLTSGILQLPPVGASHRTRIHTLSMTQLIMNLEMIALLCRTRIATSLTVFNAHGPGPRPTRRDGMVMMLDADVNISEVTKSPTQDPPLKVQVDGVETTLYVARPKWWSEA